MKRPIDILRRMPKFGGFLVKKPDFGRRVLAHHAREKLVGGHWIRAIEYAVTYRCQATCDKCSAVKMLDTSRDTLTLPQIRTLADDCYRLGTYEVNFTGGEPLLDNGLEDLITEFHPSSTFIGINTNGALLDRRRILSLRDAGADLLKISIDSPVDCEHDLSRGIDGLYDHVMDVFRMAREIRGIRAHGCIVATRDAVASGKVARTLETVKALDGTLGVVFPSATGGWSQKHEVLLDGDTRAALDQMSSDPDVFVQGNVGKGEFRCPCGTREIYISCYGDVIPCPFIQIAFGNVTEERFDSIYRRMAEWKSCERQDVCSSAEDPAFVDRYVDPIAERPTTPVDYREHPAWKGDEN
jgi:MoaA/NifB/PqqE/SkfB family radical SAM enzyme